MKYNNTSLFLLVLTVLFFASCEKNDPVDYPDPAAQFELEKPIIKTYVNTSFPGMTYSSDTTGIWFEIIEPGIAGSYTYKVVDTTFNGQATKVVRPPSLKVRYKGSLIPSAVQFDANQTTEGMSGKLSDYIAAWYYAFIPKSIGTYKTGGLTPKGLQKGTKIRIATPSGFAYGSRTVGSVPANSPLLFEIEVVEIQ